MAKLGAGSLAKLGECHPDLQRVVKRAVQIMPDDFDFTVLCGWRGKAEQDAAFKAGKSMQFQTSFERDGQSYRFRFGDPAIVTPAVSAQAD